MMKRILKILIILDGWGIAPSGQGNAISLAKTPNFDKFIKKYPNTLLDATGRAVGLPDKRTSGSEAGHSNVGAGRVVKQDVRYISESINSGVFFHHPTVRKLCEYVKTNNSNLHLMGLLSSEESPHCDRDHLDALLILAKNENIKNVYLHLFTDGRDTFKRESLSLLQDLNKRIEYAGLGKIATITGRFYAMDRVKNWDRLHKAYDAIVNGKGEKANSAEEAIWNAYEKGLNDEFIEPTVIIKNVGGKQQPVCVVKENDAIVFFNFRSDRARQLTKLFVLNKIDGYKRPEPKLDNLLFVALTDFGPDLSIQTVFQSKPLKNTLPVVLKSLKQLYIAESEKYAHITYFFNGGYSNPIAKEDRIMISSPKVSSYDQAPEMSAFEIVNIVLKEIKYNVYDFIAINFANADMVGHTGNLAATVKAVEAVDKCIGMIASEVQKRKGIIFITADHGNAEKMIDEKTGEMWTMHTKNPVPFIVIGAKNKKLKDKGVLGDVAPTILDILEVKQPKEMSGKSLIVN